MMFGKLWKYEWMAMMRKMCPVYGAVLVISLVNGLGIFSHTALPADFLEGLLALLYVVALVVLCVITVLAVIERFYDGLFKQEGYLMFTLPVKVRQIVASKACVAVLMVWVSVLAAFCSIILLDTSMVHGIAEGFRGFFLEFMEAFHASPAETAHMALFLTELMIAGILWCFMAAYHFYVAMALGHLSRNHRGGLSVLWYVVIYVAGCFVNYAVWSLVRWLPAIGELFSGVPGIHILGIGLILYHGAKLALYAFGTEYILTHRLNLE